MNKVISTVEFSSNSSKTKYEQTFNVIILSDMLDDSVIKDWGFDTLCVTTNGVVKANGELVMGAGVAKQFANKFKDIATILGRKVKTYGNTVYHVGKFETNDCHKIKYDVLSFPTKHNYKDKSDLSLIVQSAKRLVKWADKTGACSILIPSPGTGLGGLSQYEVFNALDGILDDRFTICMKDISK